MNLPTDSRNGKRLSFVSGGKEIGVMAYRTADLQAPSILVLHGAGGVDAGNRYVAQLAHGVAANGFNTFIVEYFDRTGTTYASEPEIRLQFEPWLETIRDAVSFISQLPGIDAQRIGTFGYSLGGYLVVGHASRDSRVKAAVELAGGIDPEFAKGVTRLPPLLIIHGEEDQRVPFARARELQAFVAQLGTELQTVFYPGERHIFSPAAAFAAIANALNFFRAHLK